ncbi:hypothetical protein N0V93_009031 [Gnomoniopsis smithogilvyi]|uniref:FAD dependent oxidoreductase domain-containing protein n=1 Tax=Gnomoniopsis smithogilvyi TaxID=1191159 RepID=A0A9W8YK25_9PEZI|nr:hypothetical protein N0V93_009031 [Gnomoniopsis smithogilvyi]
MPVTYARDLGFFFESDTENLHLFFRSRIYKSDTSSRIESLAAFAKRRIVPLEDERRIKKLLREALPELAEQRLICKHVCWIADSADSGFIIDFVPRTQGLIIASGDSGHGFKYLLTIGRFIQGLVEQGAQDIPQWKGKEGNDASGNVSWRTGDVADLKDVVHTSRS